MVRVYNLVKRVCIKNKKVSTDALIDYLKRMEVDEPADRLYELQQIGVVHLSHTVSLRATDAWL